MVPPHWTIWRTCPVLPAGANWGVPGAGMGDTGPVTADCETGGGPMPAAATDATAVMPAASAHPVMPASTQDRENPIPCMMTPFVPASSQALRPAEPDRQHLLHAAAQLQVAPRGRARARSEESRVGKDGSAGSYW